MSGYFVHGGTQYAYSQQPAQQTAAAQTASYQQPAQTTQFYQSTTYPAAQPQQTTRTALAANKPAVATGSIYGTGYSSQTLGQTAAYSNQHAAATTQSYAYESNSYGRQTSAGANSYGRTNYGTSAANSGYGSTGYGAAKAEDKYTGGNTFTGYSKPAPSAASYSLGLTGNSLSSGGNSSYFTQPSQQPSYSTSYPAISTYNKPEEASSSQYSYEKALYVAANQYYLNKKNEASNRGGAGRGGGGGRGRGRGGRGSFGGSGGGQTSTGPKIIKATEVKAYLYAWCGQRRLKPEYTIEPCGMPPRMKFVCTLKISGLEYIAKVTAASKKDSQSKAAWDFCEHLVKTGYMKESELPQKPVDPAPKAPKAESEAVSETPEQVEENGGWTLENCRQRLNQFTQRWRIPSEFKHETHGPEHARSFAAELSLRVKWLDKEFTAKERGSNKKQATAVCALAMLRQLYKEGLVEKQGDPIKHPRRGGEKKEATKRKADEESNGSDDIDEFGNWKLDDSRQRLHIYCQSTNQPLDIKYTPDDNTPPKMFTASVSINVSVDSEDKTLDASYTCAGKKIAAQHVAQQIIKQLYDLSLVEPNLGVQQSKKKNPRPRGHGEVFGAMDSLGFGGPMFGGPGPMFGPFGGPTPPMQRKTPYEDAIIFEKHKRIYPTELELRLIEDTVRTIEKSLKQVSDELSDAMAADGKKPIKQEVKQEPDEKETDENSDKEDKRMLQGVMRVGSLAKGLLLGGDVSAQLVLLSVNVPTTGMLTKIGSILSRVLEEGGQKYLVEIRLQECMITIISPPEMNDKDEPVRCTVRVYLTSPLMRTLEPTTGPADMLDRDKCLQSLAELRHAKWFQACAKGIPSCVILIRIFKDMKRRNSTWNPLSDWALELVIEKALRTSLFGQLTVGEGLRRVLSCLSSGILLADSGGLYDPCEKTPTDVIQSMTLQEREDVTESAHHALRMLVFRQTHKILGIEPLPQRVRRSTDGDSTMETI
ncbi:uncharacterized protein LOC120330203 [Styela clava]